jgi:hypothetical protein
MGAFSSAFGVDAPSTANRKSAPDHARGRLR